MSGEPPGLTAILGELGDPQILEVNREMLYRTLDFVLARAVQNHKLHQDWNEGAGDFAACTRGDCTEVKALLNEWGLGY